MANVPVGYRFWSMVEVGSDGCLNWIGGTSGNGPYGTFWDGQKKVRAHRWAYIQEFGEFPDGLEPDHLCRNKLCVNPYHMEAVTHLVNVQRSENAQSKKTTCKRGHAYDEVNTYFKNGSRHCKICKVQATRRWRARQKEAVGE